MVRITKNKKTGCKQMNLNQEITCRKYPCYRECYDAIVSKAGNKLPSYTTIKKSRNMNHTALYSKNVGSSISKEIGTDKFFRWLGGGDLTTRLTPVIKKVAAEKPDVLMHLPTKNFKEGLKLYGKFDNLQVIFSMWPGWELNHLFKDYRHSIVIPRHAKRAPAGYFLCPGKCPDCHYCYRKGGNVAYRYHGTRGIIDFTKVYSKCLIKYMMGE